MLIEPAKGVILNSITDDSEVADAIPEVDGESKMDHPRILDKRNTNKTVIPLSNDKIYEHTFGKSS